MSENFKSLCLTEMGIGASYHKELLAELKKENAKQ